MRKGRSATDANIAYIALGVIGGVVADGSKDAMAEEFPDPPMNLYLNNMGGDSHGSKRENYHDAKDITVCDNENDYDLEEG